MVASSCSSANRKEQRVLSCSKRRAQWQPCHTLLSRRGARTCGRGAKPKSHSLCISSRATGSSVTAALKVVVRVRRVPPALSTSESRPPSLAQVRGMTVTSREYTSATDLHVELPAS